MHAPCVSRNACSVCVSQCMLPLCLTALQFMMSDDADALQTLTTLSTMEKLDRMDSERKVAPPQHHGSRTSLSSRLSLRSSLADSIADLKKGLD